MSIQQLEEAEAKFGEVSKAGFAVDFSSATSEEIRGTIAVPDAVLNADAILPAVWDWEGNFLGSGMLPQAEAYNLVKETTA